MELARTVTFLILLVNLFLGVAQGITTAEAERIEKLRKLVTPERLYRDFMRDDEFLLSWLKSRNMDPAEAAKMLQSVQALQWRKDNNIDSVISENHLKCDQYYPSITDAKDKLGRPIWQIPMRKWDVRKFILGNGNNEGFVRCMVQYFELMCENARNSTLNVTKFVVVINLSGFNLRQHACISCIAAYVNATRFYESYYPGSIAKAYFINSPQVFQTTLELGKAVMSQETKDSLNVYGYNRDVWQASLLKDIAKEQLTQDFGGTRKL